MGIVDEYSNIAAHLGPGSFSFGCLSPGEGIRSRFGSYFSLIASDEFRYRKASRA